MLACAPDVRGLRIPAMKEDVNAARDEYACRGIVCHGGPPRNGVGGTGERPVAATHPTNPRYFTDGTKLTDGSLKAVYLTGSHTWNNLVDIGRDDPPQPFIFEAYLDFLERHGHSFIRLWAWDSTSWDTRGQGREGKSFVHHASPQPWARTGPGEALDGKPKFDLTKFNADYFERLRSRVRAAGERGIYVSVMLFEGWGMMHGTPGTPPALDGWPWRTHPFNRDNNINGINADADGDDRTGEVHSRAFPAVNAIQAAYIRKVVDTVNDLDNVLYEVINEGGQKDWDWWVVNTVRDHESAKPKQHPVGVTGHGARAAGEHAGQPGGLGFTGRATTATAARTRPRGPARK